MDDRTRGPAASADSHQALMVAQKVVLGNVKFEIEDIEELALDAADITFAENTSAECPVYVLQSRIVEILYKD